MPNRLENQGQQVLRVASKLGALLEGMETALLADTTAHEIHLHTVMSRAVEMDRLLAIYIHLLREQRESSEE